MKVAAVHAAPVFMDKKASTDKVVSLIQEAAEQEVELLVFPEAFIPGYPAFIWAYPPLTYIGKLLEYGEQSVSVLEPESMRAGVPAPSTDIERVLEACKSARLNVVLGISKRAPFSPGTTLFNSQVFISSDGSLLGVHRKLVPTFSERSVWAYGGGATLRCWNMPQPGDDARFIVSGLVCAENWSNGAVFALSEAGEHVHAASWPALCAFVGREQSWRNTKLCAQSHSCRTGTYTIAASSILGDSELTYMKINFGAQDFTKVGSGWSGIVTPSGEVLSDTCGGLKDQLVVADIDFKAIAGAKILGDPAGHFKRPEVLRLDVNRTPIWADDVYVACFEN